MITIREEKTVKVPGITSLFVSFDYQKVIVEELKLLESYYYNDITREWEIPLTCMSEFIDRVCRYDSIKIELKQTVKETSQEYTLLPYKTDPYPYQRAGIQYGLNHDSWLLLDAPGLGKSLQMICLASELKSRYQLQHCLVICGVNTLKSNWKNEILKHSNQSCMILGERVNRKGRTVVDGIAARLKQLNAPIDEFFVITNIETIRDDKIIKALRSNKFNKFDMIVVDEIHVAKSCNSTQGKNLLKLGKDAKWKIGCTGTLLLNNPFDAYVPLKWIGAERSCFSNFRYYYGCYGGTFGNELLGFKHVDILKNQLEKYSLRRTKDVLPLRAKTVITEYVDMPEDQQKFYDNIVDGIVDQIDKVILKPANILAMVGRLRQATSCPSILTTDPIQSGKLNRAEDFADQITSLGEKLVIFSTFKEPVYTLAKQLERYNPVVCTGDISDFDIANNIVEFQTNPDRKIFLATWQKCGTGITLTAASYAVFLDTPFTPGQFEQCCDRIHRIGTKGSVFIYNLVAKGTIDERVLDIVSDKRYLADYITDDIITQEGYATLQKYIQELDSFSS